MIKKSSESQNLTEAYMGEWWLPNNPDLIISGNLTVKPNNGGKLELFFSDSGYDNILSMDDECGLVKLHNSIINGKMENGEYVTLKVLEFVSLPTKIVMRGIAASKIIIDVDFVIIGKRFEKEDDIIFSSCAFRYDHLDTWGWENEEKIKLPPLGVIDYSYKAPEPLKIQIDDDIVISIITTTSGTTYKHNGLPDLSVYKFIYLESAKGMDLRKLTNYNYLIKGFIDFCYGSPGNYISTTAYYDKETQGIAINYHPIGEKHQIKELIPYDNPIPYVHIKDSLEPIIKGWLGLYKDINPIMSIYYTIIDKKHLLLNIRFSLTIQAIEAYHRMRMERYWEPIGEHRRTVVHGLSNHIPEGEEWLKEVLHFGTKGPSLRERLNKIIEEMSKYLEKGGLIDNELKELIISRIVYTRNYYTHYSGNKDKIAKSTDLYFLSELLTCILELMILRELMPAEEMDWYAERIVSIRRLDELMIRTSYFKEWNNHRINELHPDN